MLDDELNTCVQFTFDMREFEKETDPIKRWLIEKFKPYFGPEWNVISVYYNYPFRKAELDKDAYNRYTGPIR